MATIPAACQCGKRFQANEKLAGKRVKCPACGAVIHVPAMSPPEPLVVSELLEPSSPAWDPLAVPSPPPQHIPAYNPLYAPQANYGASYAAAPRKKLNTGLILGIIAGVAGLGVMMLIGLMLLLPAIQAARNAARKQAAARSTDSPQAPSSSRIFGGQTASSWKTYESTAGRYSVLMPSNVQTRTQSEPTAAGLVTAYMAVADTGAQGTYFVAYNDLPLTLNPIPTDELLDGACNGAMSRVGGRENSRESIHFAGQPARSLTFEGNKLGRQFRTQLRVLLAGRRMYQVMWLGSADNEPEDDIQSFFDSFKITSIAEAPAAPPGRGQPPPGRAGSGQPSSAASPDEARRQLIYREVQRVRRTIETLTQQRDRLAEQGGNTAPLDQQIERLESSEESRLESIARQHRISREQLDEIISEGDDQGWGGRR